MQTQAELVEAVVGSNTTIWDLAICAACSDEQGGIRPPLPSTGSGDGWFRGDLGRRRLQLHAGIHPLLRNGNKRRRNAFAGVAFVKIDDRTYQFTVDRAVHDAAPFVLCSAAVRVSARFS